MEFIGKVQKDTDIFCFQEMFFGTESVEDVYGTRSNIADEFEHLLKDFSIYKRLAPKGSRFFDKIPEAPMGQAIFIRNNIKVVGSGGLYTYPENSLVLKITEIGLTGNFQHITIETEKNKYLIGNLHGLWQYEGKGDTPERLEQSKVLKNFFSNYPVKKMLCGDFNLRPETESIAILNKDLKNLIKDFGITSTRNSFYEDAGKYKDFISDYVFASRDVNIIDFKTINNSVSDHLPVMVEFS